jgi:GNAT superfamily N-acetyltransferase
MAKYREEATFLNQLTIEPVTKMNWGKFVELFGDKGACGNSRVHKRIDDLAVWSITCLFIKKDFRKSGISVQLLKGAVQYAKENKIRIIEAYPTIPTKDKIPDSFAWIGLYKSFERAGFEIVDNTSRNRPMVRYYTDNYNNLYK